MAITVLTFACKSYLVKILNLIYLYQQSLINIINHRNMIKIYCFSFYCLIIWIKYENIGKIIEFVNIVEIVYKLS